MVVSRLWNVPGLFHFVPCVFVGVKLVGFFAVVECAVASEDNHSVTEDNRLVVGDFTWEGALALELNWLPLDTVLWVSHELVNT